MRWIGWLLGCLGAADDPAGAPAGSSAGAEAPIRLWLGGDVHLAGTIAAPGSPQDPLAPLYAITGGRLGMVNLEGPLMEPPEAQVEGGEIRLYNHPGVLPMLTRLGVRAAGIANNHADDGGSRGESLRRLELAGVVGVDGLARLELPGGTLGVVAVDLPGAQPGAAGGQVGAADAGGEIARAAGLLREAAAWSAAQIVTFHVTGPPGYLPTLQQREAAAAALAAGAEVVAFHGSHAVGPVERRGAAVILWGLGNVIFQCGCTDQRDAILAELEITPGQPVAVQVRPIRAGLMDAARPAPDAGAILDLLEAIGTRGLERVDGAGRLR